jgi:L-methionine (R)-S-oxide reductase
MAESVHIPTGASRAETYEALTPQLKALLAGETDLNANASNFCALVNTAFQFHWVGFYWVRNLELVLGPFQGPIACTRIAKGKGVCGNAWLRNETIIVPDVEAFPGHIACSALSKSEIVVPVRTASGDVLGVLDIDSSQLHDFSEIDQRFLELWVDILSEACHA